MRGVIDPGDYCFRPRFIRHVGKGFSYDPGMGPYPPQVALAPLTPAYHAIGQWVYGFRIVRGGIDPGYRRFCPSCRCPRGIYDPGMGHYPSRVPLAPRNPSQPAMSRGVDRP